MKSIEQTNRLLSSCIFSDDDWELVLAFCREQFGGGKVHRPRRGQCNVSFADFSTWFRFMPGQGDVVRYGGIVGLIGKCSLSEYSLCAYLGQRKQLIIKDMVVLPHKLVPATKEESSELMSLLLERGLVYSANLCMLTGVFKPSNGDFVTIKQHGSVKNGIFDHIESLNYVFYFLDGEAPAKIPILDCKMEIATPKRGMKLLEQLSRLGVMWSSTEKKLLSVPLRVGVGDKYWYINDKFYVCQANDMKTPVHEERYRNWNYFTSYAEALVFLKRMKELRMELNKGLDK